MNEATVILLDLIRPEGTYSTLELTRSLPLYPGSISADEQSIAAALQGEPLPFEAGSFDRVICRQVLHRAVQIDLVVAECARVLKPGGQIGLIEKVTPGEPAAARFINDLERFRSPLHVWAGSIDDLLTALSVAGLERTHDQFIAQRIDFNAWLDDTSLTSENLLRMQAALLHAPKKPAAWLEVSQTNHRITFSCYTAVITAQNSIAPDYGGR